MSKNQVIQIEGHFMSEAYLKEASGKIVTNQQRVEAIKHFLNENGPIKGVFDVARMAFSPDHADPYEKLAELNVVEFLVTSFDDQTGMYEIEILTDKPFPPGYKVAMAYECQARPDQSQVNIVSILFAYLTGMGGITYSVEAIA